MLRMNTRGMQNRIELKENIFSFFSILAIFMMVFIVGTAISLLLGEGGHRGFEIVVVFIAFLALATIVTLRQDELAATIVVAVSLILDWYLGTHIVAPVMALALLLIFFLSRSPERPWIKPRALWLWVLFLALTIFPAIRGAITFTDAFYYYPNLIFGALIMFWLGTVIAKDFTRVKIFFQSLAAFGMLIAFHMIFQSITGQFLFATAQQNILNPDYALGRTGIYRLASFFIQPDAGSAFLAIVFLISLGLCVECSSPFKKIFYLIQMLSIAIALLFTYSTGAWYSLIAGLLVFGLLTKNRVKKLIIGLLLSVSLYFIFQRQLVLFLQHISDPQELSLRLGLWQTAWRVIQAFPLTGIGLGRELYLERAEPYRVAAQFKPYNNPHNSYLEIGAMAGIPVLFVFLALIAFGLWLALCHWKQVDEGKRPLLGAGIAAVITMSINSCVFGIWTLPPLAVCGWMILGVISSPLLARKPDHQIANTNLHSHGQFSKRETRSPSKIPHPVRLVSLNAD